MPFKKGHSGNIKGRPRGARNRRGLILDAMAEQMNCKTRDEAELEWFKRLTSMALDEGDVTALSMLTKRIVPELKQRDSSVQISLPKSKSLAEKTATILSDMGRGKLTPHESLSILQAVALQAKIVETEELEARISQLEQNQ